jgi:hypothetical protein
MTSTAADLHQPQVTDADYVQLSRLVIEAAWRVDVGRADTLHELFVDDGTLAIGDGTLQGREQIRQWVKTPSTPTPSTVSATSAETCASLSPATRPLKASPS